MSLLLYLSREIPQWTPVLLGSIHITLLPLQMEEVLLRLVTTVIIESPIVRILLLIVGNFRVLACHSIISAFHSSLCGLRLSWKLICIWISLSVRLLELIAYVDTVVTVIVLMVAIITANVITIVTRVIVIILIILEWQSI
jgi:hypothetical protein